MDKRRRWMAALLEEGLRLGVLEPEDLLRHATPSVLATDLPPALVASVLQAGMKTGIFTPGVVVETLGPAQLAEHVPLPVLWACVEEAAAVLVREHPLTQAGGESVAPPGTVQADDVPDIEVLEP